VKINWREKALLLPTFNSFYHAIIIPEYGEPLHILERTLENLVRQDFPKERLLIILATENKDPSSGNVGSILKEKYGKKFGHFLVTSHQLRSGEVAGKSSNMAWAGKKLVQFLGKRGIDIGSVVVTSCDADALLHPQYSSYLAYTYLTDPDRQYHFYQGAILFYSNIWRIPLPNKFVNTLSSIWNLSLLSQSNRFINFSTYSIALSSVVKAGYWGIDVIPEDYHLFFKVYFAFGEKVQTRGIFLPVLVDAAESHGFIRTVINQYEQSKRWAWGISDIPYVVRGVFLHSEIPLSDRARRLILLLEHHIFWSANWFILTIGSTIPPLVSAAFSHTVLGHNLAKISSAILTLSAIFLIAIFIIDWRIKPPKPKDFATWKLPFLYLQWLTLPILSFFLAALPGLDAHTRLMLGKRLEYRVTEKV
jgi:cellulose synthase/poly-beta-1,6-N-acetylglucosamine synthase-like glycosyltransferase